MDDIAGAGGSNDFSFKLNYQSIRPADQNTGCEPAVRTCWVVESLYQLTAAHIGGNVSLYVSLALPAQQPAGRE